MAHELNFLDGEAAMMFVGEVPWHGLGTKLEKAPKNAKEAMQAAHLDWKVGLKPVYVGEAGMYYEVRDKKAVVRLDQWGKQGCVTLGIVGNDFRPLQNEDAFSFFDPVIRAGQMSYETAGALGDGERVWVMAKMNDEIVINKVDKVEKYLLLSNGHDGRTAVQIRFTPIRVVCQNTLSASLKKGEDLMKIYHDTAIHRKFGEAQAVVKKIVDGYGELAANFQLMGAKTVTDDGVEKYLAAVFPEPKRKKGQTERAYAEAFERNKAVRKTGVKLAREGAGNDAAGVRGTVWATYNGVTELVDHHWKYEDRWQRLNFLWFGEGERIKQRAFDEAMKLSAN